MSSSPENKPSYFLLCLFFILLILFLQPKLVGGTSTTSSSTCTGTSSSGLCFISDTTLTKKICSGHGSIDQITGLCNCMTNWHGGDCSRRFCPVGPSWIESSQEDHQRYRPRVECSNMGLCDEETGKCHCREGYEGRACERSLSSFSLFFLTFFLSCHAIFPPCSESCPSVNSRTCSGHGRCMTMREVSLDFNGLSVPLCLTLCQSDSCSLELRPPHRSITMGGMLML
jgi:hypothetical protein